MSKPFSPSTVAKLRELDSWAADHTLSLNWDADTLRPPECRYLCTLYDTQDNPVLSGRGTTADEAIISLHAQALAAFRGFLEP